MPQPTSVRRRDDDTASDQPARRLIAVVFTDLVASTETAALVGDVAAQEFRRSHFDAVAEIVNRHDGNVIKTMGDGVMAVFGSATDAVTAAAAIQRAPRPTAGASPQVRVGVTIGDALVEADDYFGATVTEAARLCAHAQGDQIIASAAVMAACRDMATVDVEALPAVTPRGFDAPVPIVEVVWTGQGPSGRWPMSISVPPRPIVGRKTEVGLMDRLLAEAFDDGAVRSLFIAGEAGVGKTRLALEAAVRGASRDAVVTFGRCDEAIPAPYGLWIEPLRQLVNLVGPRKVQRALDDAATQSLNSLLDDRRLAGCSAPPAGAHDRTTLFDAIAALVDLASVVAPLVVVLDDVQWADETSVLVLRYLLRSPRRRHMLVVTTYRDDEVDTAHPLSAVMTDLRRRHELVQITLDCLDIDGTSELIATWADHDPEPEFVAALHERTGGLPFFVEELLIDLATDGVVIHDAGRWHLTVDDVRTTALPVGVKNLVDQRLSKLGDDAVDLLRDAALIGTTFDVDVLTALRAATEDDVLATLDGAVDGRVVTASAERIGRYRFGHAFYRTALFTSWSPARRARRSATLLEVLRLLRPEDHMAHVEHALAAAPLASGTDVADALLGATQGLRTDGYASEAAAIARRGVATLESVGGSPAQVIDLLIDQGISESNEGDYPASSATSRRALTLARSIGDADRFAEAVAELISTGDPMAVGEDTFELCTEALGGLTDEPTAAGVLIRARLALLLSYVDLGDEGLRLIEEARSMARSVDDAACTVQAEAGFQVFLFGHGRPVERLEALRHVAEVADVQFPGHRTYERGAFALFDLLIQLEMGDRSPLEQHLETLVERASEQRNAPLSHFAGLAVATLALLDGRWEATITATDNALEHVASGPTAEIITASVRQQVAYWTGDHATVHHLMQQINGIFPPSLVGPGEAAYGRRASLDPPVPPFSSASLGQGPLRRSFIRQWVEYAVVADDPSLAPALLAALEPYRGSMLFEGLNWYPVGATARLEGQLLFLSGRLDEAIDAYGRALELEEALRARPMAVLTRCCLVETLRRRGSREDADRAQVLVDEAAGEAAQLGMSWMIDAVT
ncbi:MAG: AAA family ATPase [Acidimicrobiia bacterium]|nr:AAA family ATPase [Acidimicrobiia bacterium]